VLVSVPVFENNTLVREEVVPIGKMEVETIVPDIEIVVNMMDDKVVKEQT
jgi:hypothetical protein